MHIVLKSWNLLVLAVLIGVAVAACNNTPKVQHAQCSSNQVEVPDTTAIQAGSGCGDGGTVVMKCVNVSTGAAAGLTKTGG